MYFLAKLLGRRNFFRRGFGKELPHLPLPIAQSAGAIGQILNPCEGLIQKSNMPHIWIKMSNEIILTFF